jgi:hypothetical protein
VEDLNVETAGKLDVPTLLDLLKTGMSRYNGQVARGFALTGTAMDRDPNEPERRAIILNAVMVYLDGRVIEASDLAITHSNVAGRTKLDGIEFALAKRRKELLEIELTNLINRLTSPAIAAEISTTQLGETLIL